MDQRIEEEKIIIQKANMRRERKGKWKRIGRNEKGG